MKRYEDAQKEQQALLIDTKKDYDAAVRAVQEERCRRKVCCGLGVGVCCFACRVCVVAVVGGWVKAFFIQKSTIDHCLNTPRQYTRARVIDIPRFTCTNAFHTHACTH